MSTTNSSALRASSSSSGTNSTSRNIATSSSLRRTGLKRDRDTFSNELEQDTSIPNTKRHLHTTLNNTLSAAALERKVATLQTKCTDLEKKVREKDQTLDLLQKDRRWLNDRETEEREAREQEQKESKEREAQLNQDLAAARTSLSSLELSHADLKDAHSILERTRAHEVNSLRAQLDEAQQQALLLEARVREERNAAKLAVSSSELSLSQSTFSAPDADHRLLTAELNRQASYLRQLESINNQLNADVIVLKSENSTLRERNATVEVLREDKRGLESRLRMKEVEIEKLVQKTEELARESSSRRSSSAHLPLNPSTLSTHLGLDEDDTHPTVNATSELASLRLKHATLLDTHGTILAELTAIRRERDALRDASVPKVEIEKQHGRVEISNLRIRLRLKDEELTAALKELAFLEGAVAQLTSDSQSDAMASVHESRVQHLEGLLNNAKFTNTSLRNEIETLLETMKQGSESESTLQQKQEKDGQLVKEELSKTKAELQEEKQKREDLEKSLDSVEQTLFDLRGEVAGGRHIPPNTRILEMKDNPHAVWETSRTAVLERLKEENQALLKRLADVEAEVNVSKTRAEAIHTKSAEFREAIESIMGVKLAFYPNGQVRVTSLFDLNASFVFGSDKTAKSATESGGMKMQLVGTGEGGPQDLPDMMRYWIETESCIPGFLASVTLECYESSKKHV
ncbi:hypothetical protein BDP27DRAFT_1330495 [Rhodocollybia butyracea]|uniref:Spindle assembly checkpoint component MAD1 n=1 Tax=Rhodocollybia butyracea TaxID=206335 RepID=A0A9P5U575_9AGAR|nr:hypothetical protein BDP27DRAFT_1330495 [Rhodocollybia butyracea]